MIKKNNTYGGVTEDMLKEKNLKHLQHGQRM